MGESAHLLEARFILSVGDNFYENGVSGVHDPAWQSSFEDVYRAPGAGSRMARYCDIGGSDFCSLHPGFVACGLTATRLRVAYRDYRGAELHVVDIARPT